MAPSSAPNTRPVPGNIKRIGPRVVPAVPLAFSKPSSAIKNKATLTGRTNNVSVKAEEVPQKSTVLKENEKPQSVQTNGTSGLEHEQQSAQPNNQRKDESHPEAIVAGENMNMHAQFKENITTASHARQSSMTNRIPNELPPPFYPSESHSTPTPTSATSSIPQQEFHNSNVTIHHPRPNGNRIAFGGYSDSANTSPAPPSGGMMPFQVPLHPPPGFVPSNFGGPPPFFPGHAQHLSDPHGNYPIVPPPGPFGYRNDQYQQQLQSRQQQPWFPPEAHTPYNARQQDYRGPTVLPNGHGPHSRSPSQGSSKTQEQESGGIGVRPQQYSSPTANGTQTRVVNGHSENASLLQLRDWLAMQFGNPDLADYILEIYYDREGSLYTFPVHGIFAARSPILHSLMKSQSAHTPQGTRIIRLSVPNLYFTGLSYEEALKCLYGALLLGSKPSQPLPPFQLETTDTGIQNLAIERLNQALSYALAGHNLGLPSVVIDGFEVASGLLRWDTVEKALEFALNDGIISLGSSKDGIDSTYTSNDSPPRSPRASIFEAHRSSFQRVITDFIANNLPRDFSPNTTAPQLSHTPLLPPVADSRPNKHRSRLSQIRFGDLPVDKPSSAPALTTLISSILLSLPFYLLKYVVESPALGTWFSFSQTFEIANALVQEREIRRAKVLQGKPQAHETGPNRLWENAMWEEYVERSREYPGFRLCRRRQQDKESLVNGSSSP